MAGGKMVDSTYSRLSPMEFSQNTSDVIAGLKNGVLGMKKGGKRKLIIPPHLGFGNKSTGLIPPNSHLVFEIELIEILSEKKSTVLQKPTTGVGSTLDH
jgi:peptidylprolyl isomerase